MDWLVVFFGWLGLMVVAWLFIKGGSIATHGDRPVDHHDDDEDFWRDRHGRS